MSEHEITIDIGCGGFICVAVICWTAIHCARIYSESISEKIHESIKRIERMLKP